LIKQAIRLNPIPPVWYYHTLGHAYFLTEQYGAAIVSLKRVVNRNPNFWPAHVYLIASYVYLKQDKKAQAARTELLRVNPNYSFYGVKEKLPYKDQTVIKGLYDILKKVNL
jgi:tetratricopeptide (TPR) repeat protein